MNQIQFKTKQDVNMRLVGDCLRIPRLTKSHCVDHNFWRNSGDYANLFNSDLFVAKLNRDIDKKYPNRLIAISDCEIVKGFLNIITFII